MIHDHRQVLRERDAKTLLIMGVFLLILSAPVLAGVYFAVHTIDRVINVASGVVMGLVGVAFVLRAASVRAGAGVRPPGSEESG